MVPLFVKRAELGGSEKEGLSKNYIGKLVKLVKSVLRFAEAQGETVHQAYRTREFRVLSEDVAHIYLTEDDWIDSRPRLKETVHP